MDETVSLYRRRRHGKEALLSGLIWGCAALTVAVLLGILLYVLARGLPHIRWEFLTGVYSARDPAGGGILPMLLNTLYIVLLTLAIVTPLGLGGAVYLTQYAKQGRLLSAIRFTTELLAGIPSVLFGLFGYTLFCVGLGLGTSLLAGSLTMSLVVLPTMIRTTEESLLTVPRGYQEGALALGAGKLRVILGITLPCAVPGILTAVVLGMGRIVGESAALLFTSGMGYEMPRGVFSHIFDSGRTLTLHLYQTAKQAASPEAFDTAFATAAVLLLLVFLLNRLASFLSRATRGRS